MLVYFLVKSVSLIVSIEGRERNLPLGILNEVMISFHQEVSFTPKLKKKDSD